MVEGAHTRVKGATGALYLIGGLNLALGLAALLIPAAGLQRLVYPPFAIPYGLGFLLLAWFARRNPALALLVGLVVFGLEVALSLFGLLAAGGAPTLAYLVVRAALLLMLYLGWRDAQSTH